MMIFVTLKLALAECIESLRSVKRDNGYPVVGPPGLSLDVLPADCVQKADIVQARCLR